MLWSILRWVLGVTAMEDRLCAMEERVSMLEMVVPPPRPGPPAPLYDVSKHSAEKEKVH
jgi:hypothetical protein